MKKQMLLVCLLIAVTLQPILALQNESKINLEQAEENRNNNSALVVDIEEAEKAIDEAYAEGYKAGLLEAAPEAIYYKTAYEAAIKNKTGFDFKSFGAGAAFGIALTTAVMILFKAGS